MRGVGHGLVVGLILYLCVTGLMDAPANLLREAPAWVRTVGILQVTSSVTSLAWLWGLYRGAAWTLPVFGLWSLQLVALGSIATFAWSEFSRSAVLGAAISLAAFCALTHWWVRALLRRRRATPV